jgi:hypothetical protein
MDELREIPLAEWQARGVYNPGAFLARWAEEDTDLIDDTLDNLS